MDILPGPYRLAYQPLFGKMSLWSSPCRPTQESGRNRAYRPNVVGKREKYEPWMGIKLKTYQTLGSALSTTYIHTYIHILFVKAG